MSNISQEIVDWYNENESDEHAEYIYQAWEDFYDAIWSTQYNKDSETATLASGRAVIVEDFGGEGQGDTRYVVFQVGDKLYRVDGYYASWDGTTWDDPDPYEVTPKEVTVIEYVRA